MDYFFFNNCKIANELRKYRDLAEEGVVNQVSLSGERGRRPSEAADWAEYVITKTLTYQHMMAANAVYTLMARDPGKTAFRAGDIARILAGDPGWRSSQGFRDALERRLRDLAETKLYILADHDHQVERNLYEGAFLPVTCPPEGETGGLFQFCGQQMPLYEYARDHRQIIRINAALLRGDGEAEGPAGRGQRRGAGRRSEQAMALRHHLLQELAIVGSPSNRVQRERIFLLKRSGAGWEGLLPMLDMLKEGEEQEAAMKKARTVQQLLGELLEGWRESGGLGPVRYEELGAKEGYGVLLERTEQPQKTQASG